MASNAMRANSTLPLPLLAAHRRNIRIPHKRDADASCFGSADTSGSQSTAQPCECYARVSSSSRYVASGRPFDVRISRYALGEVVANRAQLLPAAVNFHRLAVAVRHVPVGSTRRAKPLTVFTTLHKGRRCEQPGFPDGLSHVELMRLGIEWKDIRIVSLFLTRGREDEMLILRHFDTDVLQAAPARHFAGTAHSSAEIEAARTCRRKPALDMNRRRGAHVSGLPHRIVG